MNMMIRICYWIAHSSGQHQGDGLIEFRRGVSWNEGLLLVVCIGYDQYVDWH